MLRFDRGKDHPPPRHRTTWASCLGTIAAVIGGFILMGALAVGLAFLLGLFDTVTSTVS
jgi:ABC-type nitrate/sulfonate/bicarbonate transport system permease component